LRIKFDENIGRSALELLQREGHDVATVSDQGVAGVSDEVLLDTCTAERRALITLDRDFGQVPRFPPKRTAGIIILELGGPASLRLLHDRLRDFLALAATRSGAASFGLLNPAAYESTWKERGTTSMARSVSALRLGAR
jgi:hypothetical protein